MAEPQGITFVITVTCPYCTKARSPVDMRSLPGGAKICESCRSSHDAALLALSGLKANADGTMTSTAPPPARCSECDKTPAQLKAMGIDGDRFSVIYENGIYRYFCTPCADLYETKRKEFFKGTKYAQQRGL